MMSKRQVEKYLAWEVHQRKIPRKPPQRDSILRTKPARDYRYRAWIRSLPSAVSGLTPCQACHTGPHALGQKASDYTCIPLTVEEHVAYDRDPQGFSQKYGLDVPELTRRLTKCWFTAKREGL